MFQLNVNIHLSRLHAFYIKHVRYIMYTCQQVLRPQVQVFATNLLQTKSMLAAMKKRKHSTWVKQYIRDRHRYDAYSTMLPEMKANDMS